MNDKTASKSKSKSSTTKKVAAKKIVTNCIELLARKDGLKVYKSILLDSDTAARQAADLLYEGHHLNVDSVVLRKGTIGN